MPIDLLWDRQCTRRPLIATRYAATRTLTLPLWGRIDLEPMPLLSAYGEPAQLAGGMGGCVRCCGVSSLLVWWRPVRVALLPRRLQRRTRRRASVSNTVWPPGMAESGMDSARRAARFSIVTNWLGHTGQRPLV